MGRRVMLYLDTGRVIDSNYLDDAAVQGLLDDDWAGELVDAGENEYRATAVRV